MTTVAVLSLGWKLSEGSFCRLASRKRCTWFSSSFTKPKGDTEPGLGTIKFLIDLANEEDIPVVFTIELSSGKVAGVISESSSAVPRTFYSLQNISRDDFNAGETYLSLMWKNTQVLKEALS